MKQRLVREYFPLSVWFLLLADVLLLGWWNWLLPPATLLLLCLLTGAGLLWLLALRRSGSELLATPLDGPLLLLLAAILVSSLLALDPSRSWRQAGQWLLVLLAFYGAVVAGRSGWSSRVFSKSVLLTLSLALLAAYYQLYTWLARWYLAGPWPDLLPPALPRVWGITNSPNVLAVMLNMGFFLAVAHWQTRRGRPPIPLLLWFVAVMPMLLLPASRGGWLGFVVAALVYVASGRRNPSWGRRELIWAGAGVVAAGILLWLLTSWLRPSTITTAGDRLDIVFRTRFWAIALDAWQARPIWGHGLNSYATFFLEATPVPFSTLFVAAHNLFFQTLVDMGLLGFSAVAWLTVRVWQQVWARRRHSFSPWQRALLAGLAAFGVHSLFDTPETWIMFLAALFLGLLVAEWSAAGGVQASDELERIGPFAWRWLWPVLAGALLLAGFWGWRADDAYYRGQQAATAGNWAAAAEALALAQARLPFEGTAVAVGQALSQARLAGGQPAARAAYEVVLAQEPGWSLHYANQAALLWAAGAEGAAVAHMEQAIALAPDVPLYYLNLGLWYEALNRPVAAAEAYQRLAALPNVWLGHPFWQQTTVRAAAAAEAPPTAAATPIRSVSELEARLAENPYQADLQFELGEAYLAQDESAAAAAAWQRAAVLAATLHPAGQTRGRARFVSLWRLALPGADTEAATRLADNLRRQSVYGPGTAGAGNYVLTVFVRLPLPVDLVPQLRCFTSGAAWAGELLALEAWLTAAGRAAEVAWIQPLLAGDGDGTVACGEVVE